LGCSLACRYLFPRGGILGFFRKTVSDQDWLLSALPLYESAMPIVGTISEAFATGYRKELNSAVGKVLDELPSLVVQLSRLPTPRTSAARLANRNLRSSLNAYVRLARELNGLSELSSRGLHELIASHGSTAELLYSAHLNAIGAIAGQAAQFMGEAKDFFSGAAHNTGLQAKPQ
jgi:hypothetical protein